MGIIWYDIQNPSRSTSSPGVTDEYSEIGKPDDSMLPSTTVHCDSAVSKKPWTMTGALVIRRFSPALQPLR